MAARATKNTAPVEPVEVPPTEVPVEDTPIRTRRGSKPFTLTALAKDMERAERRLNVLRKATGLDKATEKLEKAQAAYDEAVVKAAELPEAEAAYEAAKKAFDDAVAGRDAE